MTNSIMNPEHLLHNISVSCVVFGCDGESLKVLLLKPAANSKTNLTGLLQIPEDLVHKHESLPNAVNRIIKSTTSLESLTFKQFCTKGYDLDVLEEQIPGVKRKTISVCYYALMDINKMKTDITASHHLQWVDVEQLADLFSDHLQIIQDALSHLRNAFLNQQEGYYLLPKKFTLTALQCLYEVILGKKMDKRNFRKVIIEKPFLKPLKTIEKGKAHRPAKLYTYKQISI
jgi:8-oxo-dGTP diphosphatase